jgi:hypothetical protein
MEITNNTKPLQCPPKLKATVVIPPAAVTLLKIIELEIPKHVPGKGQKLDVRA